MSCDWSVQWGLLCVCVPVWACVKTGLILSDWCDLVEIFTIWWHKWLSQCWVPSNFTETRFVQQFCGRWSNGGIWSCTSSFENGMCLLHGCLTSLKSPGLSSTFVSTSGTDIHLPFAAYVNGRIWKNSWSDCPEILWSTYMKVTSTVRLSVGTSTPHLRETHSVR